MSLQIAIYCIREKGCRGRSLMLLGFVLLSKICQPLGPPNNLGQRLAILPVRLCWVSGSTPTKCKVDQINTNTFRESNVRDSAVISGQQDLI